MKAGFGFGEDVSWQSLVAKTRKRCNEPAAEVKRSTTRTRWITRSNAKVDRVACPWLIRRFIDPAAEFFFVPENELLELACQLRATPFDANRFPEIQLNHRAERCTFEAILEDYKINDPVLRRLALIVRGADISGQDQIAAESPGLRAIAHGFALLGISDEARLTRQFPVYDALYEYLRHEVSWEFSELKREILADMSSAPERNWGEERA